MRKIEISCVRLQSVIAPHSREGRPPQRLCIGRVRGDTRQILGRLCRVFASLKCVKYDTDLRCEEDLDMLWRVRIL